MPGHVFRRRPRVQPGELLRPRHRLRSGQLCLQTHPRHAGAPGALLRPCHRSSQHPEARQRLDQQVPATRRPAATPGSTRETQPSRDHGSCHRLRSPELAPHRGLPAAALGKAGGRDRHTAGRARAFRKTRVPQGEPRYASASNRCGWPRPSSPTTSLTPLSETRSVSRSLLQVQASLGELQAGARPLKSKVNHI